MSRRVLVLIGLLVIAPGGFAQQQLDLATVSEAIERDGRFVFSKTNVLALKYDYTVGSDTVEAIAFRPVADGKYPAIVLIPGYSRTARDYIPMGLRMARDGFVCVALTQRGFGKSTGQPDFVGPKTLAGLQAGFERFRNEPYVDVTRMGLFGYSRGALAASLLACRLTDHGLRGAVFASGIYDFKKAYSDIPLEGIRANMKQEAGLSEPAIAERTAVTQMKNLPCPVLILHGEKDENAPVNQAYLLRDRLRELKKEFELKTFPDRDHDLGRQNLNDATLAFFKAKLTPGKTK